MPAASRTARTPPPAMTPVPGEAGRSSTRAALKSPIAMWGIVVPTSGMRPHDLAGPLRGLAHRVRALRAPCHAEADLAVIVTHDDHGPEGETPAALQHLRGAGDMHDALVELFALFLAIPWAPLLDPGPCPAAPRLRPDGRCSRVFPLIAWHQSSRSLELQPALAGPIGQRLDPAMIGIAAAIEHHLFQALRQGSLATN